MIFAVLVVFCSRFLADQKSSRVATNLAYSTVRMTRMGSSQKLETAGDRPSQSRDYGESRGYGVTGGTDVRLLSWSMLSWRACRLQTIRSGFIATSKAFGAASTGAC
jgi:hypothetical protein